MWFIGFEHKRLCFIKQASTIDSSRGVSIDQFRDDVLRITEDQDLLVVFILKELQALKESQPFCFIVRSGP